MPESISYNNALIQGFVGAAGAVPGTVLSFPFDSIKIRQQTTPGLSLFSASNTQAAWGFHKGMGHAVNQKVMTRFPMFLVSAIAVEKAEAFMSEKRAAFFGSAVSGYATGSIASIAEWNKVQNSRGGGGGERGGLLARSIRAHGLFLGIQKAIKRAHFCGMRNGCFDSIFFGTKHILTSRGYSDGTAYASAASVAVVGDFAMDVIAKRLMAVPPEDDLSKYKQGMFRETFKAVAKEGVGIFRGVVAKTGEFAISYFITGLCAATVMEKTRTLLNKYQ
ncbi:hypothetical protein TrST_g3396 [Triparma strigata]|uniref:Mitochondrial carrier protein n=1 Tax=Triparma strigata TaxID=1606541 RepID=A0A9W7C0S1_9STRA|nr:hypothetical protein TrST_g3396 [Triparma strigata]